MSCSMMISSLETIQPRRLSVRRGAQRVQYCNPNLPEAISCTPLMGSEEIGEFVLDLWDNNADMQDTRAGPCVQRCKALLCSVISSTPSDRRHSSRASPPQASESRTVCQLTSGSKKCTSGSRSNQPGFRRPSSTSAAQTPRWRPSPYIYRTT
ncbi:hypothetical protein MPH_01785 [Macrophomina phaseolina MS6]|uniref:Uncharacterized protein n=1 Tax=Macrophomina phaseolina (strain MS6) TaxID=1126212 RepID=K2REH8_MACPH|nr:hypothetical protein MPH_01785 [Macrophomina phaseolina MS6]